MISEQDLERYLHDHIPLSRAMETMVRSVTAEGVTLEASLAILSAWALVHTRLGAEGLACRLVIMRNAMTYEKPMDGPFTATSALARPEAWTTFLRTLQRMGRARIAVVSELRCQGKASGHLEGDFVALDAERYPVSGD